MTDEHKPYSLDELRDLTRLMVQSGCTTALEFARTFKHLDAKTQRLLGQAIVRLAAEQARGLDEFTTRFLQIPEHDAEEWSRNVEALLREVAPKTDA